MPIIAFAASKGGAGKSTLCALTASQLAVMGLKTQILCADPQHSTWKWAERCMAAGRLPKTLTVERVDNETRLAEQLRQADAWDFVLIDPQGSLNQSLALSIVASDLSLVPSRASYMDAVEAVKVFEFANNLKRAHLRLVLNDVKGIDQQTGAFKEAVQVIAKNRLPYLTTIIQSRPLYAQFSKDTGSLADMAKEPAKQQQVAKAQANIALLIQEIFTLTGVGYE